MQTLDITGEQRAYAWRLVNAHGFAKRARYNGRMVDQYAGKLGETVFADAFDHPRPTAVPYDHGIDFTVGDKHVDLKTSHSERSPEPFWYTNVVDDQLHDPNRVTDVYLFAHINTAAATFHLIGWTRPDDYMKLARHVRVGDKIGTGKVATRETRNVRHDRLRPWYDYQDFAIALAMWGK